MEAMVETTKHEEQQNQTRGVEEVELAVSKILRICVIVSAVFIAVGLLMFLFSGQSGYPGDTFPTTLKDIFSGLVELKPYAIISLGLLFLIMSPVIRVAVSILVFLKERDYLYVAITGLVFLILIISFFLGKAG